MKRVMGVIALAAVAVVLTVSCAKNDAASKADALRERIASRLESYRSEFESPFGVLAKAASRRRSTTTTVGSSGSGRTTTTVRSSIYGTTTTRQPSSGTGGRTTTTVRSSGGGARGEILRVLQQYSPTGYEIVHASETFPSSYTLGGFTINMPSTGDFMMYYDGNVGSSINTIVHEMCHHYSSMQTYVMMEERGNYDWNKHYICYYTGGSTILVMFGDVFPAKEINAIAPPAIKTDRYETYVYPSEAQMSTQIEGVLGLLDEFNAYYQGTKSAFELYDYYLNETQGTPANWLEYFQEVFGTFYAYAEFKLFILNYMIYAKSKHTAVYNALMSNNDFKKAFVTVDENWQELIAAIFQRKAELIRYLRDERGYRVDESGEFLMINGSGRSLFMEEYNKLMQELAKPAYQQVMAAF